MAADNIDNKISGCTYTDVFCQWNTDADKKGSNSLSGVTNYTWNGYDVDLKQDARYEFRFEVYADGDVINGIRPIFNFYLAAPANSILFGNHYDVGGIGGSARGPAGVYHYSGDASNGDTVDAAPNTYVLDSYIDDGAGVYWQGTTYKDTAGPTGSNWADGYHTYRIVIESFASSSTPDKIKFLYDGANGTGWTQDFDLSSMSGISPDRNDIQVGYYVATDGGTMRVDTAMFDKELRAVTPPPEPPTPTPEPPVSPDVPEPSAFGMLAGLGALALVASRRRRK